MTSAAAAFAVALAASLLLTPLARRLARRLRAVDHGDGLRKLHTQPVPLLGGLAIYLALLAAVAVLPGDRTASHSGWPLPWALLASAGAICLVGCLDDFVGMRVRWKLLGQVLATLPLVLAGFVIHRIELGGVTVELGWASAPVTVGWLVTGANALNFLDGMDALASSVGLVIAGTVVVIAAAIGQPQAAFMALILAGSLTGFLFYNWQPATIFLGDAGSMLIGLWLAALAVEGTRAPTGATPLVCVLALMSLPIADMGLAVARRTLSGNRFWIADRAHIHHRLLDKGFEVAQSIALLAGTCLATGIAAYAGAVAGYELAAWILVGLLFGSLVRLRLFGHAELSLAAQTATKTLLHIVARCSAGRFKRELPTPAELSRMPLAQAWSIFVAEMVLHHVERLDLAIGGRNQVKWRSRWGVGSDASQILDSQSRHGELWTLNVRFDHPQSGWCTLRAMVAKGPATHPLNWLSLFDLLGLFGRHWAAHPDAAPDIGTDGQLSQDDNGEVQPSAAPRREAA